jgi:iron(III) transport system permease protein
LIPYYRKFQASPGWRYLSYGIASLVLTPVLVVIAAWLLPIQQEHWDHLLTHVLRTLLLDTLLLLIGVVAISWALGVGLGWVCSQFDFPGAGFLRRALILPFAMPSYVSAFVYVGLLDFSGPLRTWLRSVFGTDAFVPEVRSLWGGVILLSLSLYPYVYVLSYDAFSSQGRSSWEAARSLGARPRVIFHRLALSFARPWIAGALCLVALEVLNDFGTVSIVGVQTFTTAIYKVWFGFFSPETAAQLSSFLVLIAFAVFYLEQQTRLRREYIAQNPSQGLRRIALSGPTMVLAILFGFGIFALAFAIPALQVLSWAWQYRLEFMQSSTLSALWRTIVLASLTGITACAAAGIVVMAQRCFPTGKLERSKQLALLGYGIPGSVLAIGVFLPLVKLDHLLVDGLKASFGYGGGLILTGTVLSMVIALTIRFLAVGASSIDAGLERVSTRLDEAATLFGVYGWAQFRQLHWPLLKVSFASGFLLVFVDVIKEMPLTLMTRPFGWDTLSVRIYGLISEGEWQRAAVPASLLLLTGMIPLVFFNRNRS